MNAIKTPAGAATVDPKFLVFTNANVTGDPPAEIFIYVVRDATP
jgi:hypothetical protein